MLEIDDALEEYKPTVFVLYRRTGVKNKRVRYYVETKKQLRLWRNDGFEREVVAESEDRELMEAMQKLTEED